MSWGTLEKRGKSIIWGPQRATKVSYRCFFSVCAQISYKPISRSTVTRTISSLQISSRKESQHISSCFSLLKPDKGQFCPLCVLLPSAATFFPESLYPFFFNKVILFLFLKSSLFSLKAEHHL